MLLLKKQVLLRLLNSYGFHSYYSSLEADLTMKLFEVNYAETMPTMKIVGIETLKSNRMMSIFVDNIRRVEGKLALNSLFDLLMETDEFVKFAENKIIFVVAQFDDDNEVSYHPNVLINNSTTFNKYWNQIKKYVNEKFISGSYGYAQTVVTVFKVIVWNADHLKNKRIKITKTVSGSLKAQIMGKRKYHTSSLNITNHQGVLTPPFPVTLINKQYVWSGFPNLLSCIIKGFLNLLTRVNKMLLIILFCTSNIFIGTLIYSKIKSHIYWYKVIKTLNYFASVRKVHMKPKMKSGKGYIKPLIPKSGKDDKTKRLGCLNTFAAMDLETMNFEGNQVPIAISLSSLRTTGTIRTNFFTIDHTKINIINGFPDKHLLEQEVTKMWVEFFNFLKSKKDLSYQTIFVHNLGGFDGIFIFKQIARLFKPVSPSILIDESNKYIKLGIEIKKDYVVNFIDSFRLFPVGLDQLCSTFGVEGKTQKYDDRFNNFNLYSNPELLNLFKKYCHGDTRCLIKALAVAQTNNFNDYKVDITECLSASNLAMKIFRTNFMDVVIPILKNSEDRFVRDSYFGGATDVYEAECENLHYIDANSLYPFAMLKDMPLKLLNIIKDSNILKDLNLDKFFGFAKVEVYCPKTVKKPMLPVKYQGKTIYPTGRWIATYFSEEIKAVKNLNLGYEFRFIEAHEYSKAKIFDKFVLYFYDIKQNSTGPKKFLAKLCLNSLYGMFGRKQEIFQVFVVDTETLLTLTSSKIIKNVIFIEEDLYLVSIASNINTDILSELNIFIESDFTSTDIPVNSNVAIASAVTAYGRILMMQFKVLDCVVYSDTDSLFTKDLKPFNQLLSNKLGDFKDELNGLVIDKAIFLGVKQYGFKYKDENGKEFTKSVFAGVKRNSLVFEDFEYMLKGNEIKINTGNRFIRSLTKLNIQIKPSTIIIKKNNDKKLVNNCYLPLDIDLVDKPEINMKPLLNNSNTSISKVIKFTKNS